MGGGIGLQMKDNSVDITRIDGGDTSSMNISKMREENETQSVFLVEQSSRVDFLDFDGHLNLIVCIFY